MKLERRLENLKDLGLYMGVKAETSRLSPSMSSNFIFSSIDACFSNRLSNPRQIPYFSYFTRMDKQHLKQRLKQNRRILLTKLQYIFSFAKL